jgi:hypothetical protein
MKLRKEHAAIIILFVAFIVLFINAVIVLGQKDAQIRDLTKKNNVLRELHEALNRDHEDLRREKVRIMKKLKGAPGRSAQELEKEDSTDDK